jgi:hypothetical protein
MSSKDKNPKSEQRRAFLKLGGAGVAAGGAAVVLRGGAAESADATPANKAAGYRETEHVKKFYETARF